jgi:hypothetical protein
MSALDPRLERFREAYFKMAELAHYRPQAPDDGWGNIQLTAAELADAKRLAHEATEYAIRFLLEENKCEFHLGCSDFSTNKAFCWTIEAARQLAIGSTGNRVALTLLWMAAAEVVRVRKTRTK